MVDMAYTVSTIILALAVSAPLLTLAGYIHAKRKSVESETSRDDAEARRLRDIEDATLGL